MKSFRKTCIASLSYIVDQLSSDPKDALTNRFYQAKMDFEDSVEKMDDDQKDDYFRRYADASVYLEKARVILNYVKRSLEGKGVDDDS